MNDASSQQVLLIAVYARVSTARQEEEGTIETQLSAIREFAGKNRYEIVKDYIDNGWSGDMLARPALDQLREEAKKKLWQAVLIYDPDRLARRYSFQELVMDELRDLGIETLFVTVSPSKNHEDRLMYGVRGIFAEYERTKIAERFRLGRVRKAKEGQIFTAEAPYGYIYIKKSEKRPGHYQINQEEAATVRRMFGLVADEGLTIRKLSHRLYQLGIRPPKSPRGIWSIGSLSQLLRNKTYIGEGHFGATYPALPDKPRKRDVYKKRVKTSARKRPESEWIKIPTPAIVDEQLFLRVQERLSKNSATARRNRKYEYLLSGKVRCACGYSRQAACLKHGRYLYYWCSNRTVRYPLPATCTDGAVNARIVDALVWEKVTELMTSRQLLKQQVQRWASSRGDGPQASQVDIGALDKQIRTLKRQEDRYARAYAEGLFSLERLEEYISPVKEKVASLEGEIAKARSSRKELRQAAPLEPHDLEAFAKRAAAALVDLDFEARRAIVMNVIEKVVATKASLEVHGIISVADPIGLCSKDRGAANATRYTSAARFMQSIPFNLKIPLPPPLKRGVDCGFLPGTNISSKGD